MNAKYNVWIENKKSVVLSPWRAALLQAADDGGSIAGAAKKMGVSESTARKKIREMETALGSRLLATGPSAVGGKSLHMTPRARKLLDQFAKFSAGLDEDIAQRYQAAFGK
jgi:molybdate transport repressor ModE-like protein